VAVEIAEVGATALASAIGAFAAAAIGYRYAIAKFRRERVFDRQLSWYEKATGSLIDAANRLNWALAADLAGVAAKDRERAWAEAISALVSLRGLEAEAEMYASPEAYGAISEAVQDVTELVKTIWVVDGLSDSTQKGTPRHLYEVCFKMLYHAASRVATNVRLHMALPAIQREWRLYDQEYRELRAELDAWKRRGKDFNDGAWPLGSTSATPAGQPNGSSV
jgi:hypothetical protein